MGIEQNRLIAIARKALADSLKVPESEIVPAAVRRERVPSPPRPPGTLGSNPVIYRYIIMLEHGDNVYRYRGKRGQVYLEARA